MYVINNKLKIYISWFGAKDGKAQLPSKVGTGLYIEDLGTRISTSYVTVPREGEFRLAEVEFLA